MSGGPIRRNSRRGTGCGAEINTSIVEENPLNRGDAALLALWAEGETLDAMSERLLKTPTSLAGKLVRLGLFEDRMSVNAENTRRGGRSSARLEYDGLYTIYVVRDPEANVPIYVGQTQNFRARRRNHMRHFSKLLHGRRPVVEVVETVETYAVAREVERRVIAQLSEAGYTLHNVLDRDEKAV